MAPQAEAEAKTARTSRLDPPISDALNAVADARFGGNKTKAIEAAIAIAAIVYGSPHGRGGANPADALERWAAARRAPKGDDE